MNSSTQYQSLPTYYEDEEDVRIRNSPLATYRKKRSGAKCVRIMQAIALFFTASCVGWLVHQYFDITIFTADLENLRATSSNLSQNASSVALADHIKPNLYGAKHPSTKTVGQTQHSSLSNNTLTFGKGAGNPSGSFKPVLPNPDLFGNFLDELHPADQSRYVTAIPLGGINNQMTGTYNLINLGRISSRTVILPPIIPNEHQPGPIKGQSYSRYYDLPRMIAETGIEMIEWNSIRKEVPETDTGVYAWAKKEWKLASNPLKCWVASRMGGPKEDGGRSISERFGRGLMLDIQPEYAPGDRKKGSWRSMNAAVQYLNTNQSTFLQGSVIKDVGCITESYWLDSPNTFKDTQALIKSLRFTTWLEATVDDMIAQTLGTSVIEVMNGKAEFITVHLRRNDIASKCQPAPKNWKELAPTEYDPKHHKRSDLVSDHVDKIQLVKRKAEWQSCRFTDSYVISRVNALRNSLGKPGIAVILTTDDINSHSLALFDSQPNWHRFQLDQFIAHESYDGFDSVMIDACLLTRGIAFLGTRVSMMSRLASHRGKAWYSRASEMF
ncbi:hypothetical protein DFH28DRAFT_931388 [Melampsora americana]|nr:hypothetical protein DFH28DRAFT_931388 [Melampsora americana]